jgi:hypothetical protein
MSPPISAKTTPQTQIHVTLLGQPCLLQGPLDESTLKTIHAIGPAQLYPSLSTSDPSSSKSEAKKAFEKIKTTSNLPSLLDRYREKLLKRLEAQIAFFDNLGAVIKTHHSTALQKIGKKYIRHDFNQFQELLKKIDKPSKKSEPFRELLDQIFDSYNDRIEPDPEEEFHRAIKRLNIQYMCSFDENEEGSGDS